MKCAISSVVLVMFLMTVTCKTLDQTQRKVESQGNNLSEQQMNNLFKIFDRLGSAINRNNTRAEDGSGNNLYVIKNLSLQVSFNFDSNRNNSEKVAEEEPANLKQNISANITEILERITKLETVMQQNQKLVEVENSVLTLNVTELTNNADIEKLPEIVPEMLELDPCKTASASGLFKVQPLNQTVYCEMTTFGGGWLVFQQRIIKEDNSHLYFNRDWAEYRAGFGTVGKDSEFWLGLEALHQITSSGDYELVIELKDKNEKYGYARYSQFHVAGEDDNYRLTVGGYSGTAGDDLSFQNNMQFTTNDRDNDNFAKNCAKSWWFSGWWYNTCAHICAPNFGIGPYWHQFTRTENTAYGIYTRMMIHRK